jgi:hypothetical protein
MNIFYLDNDPVQCAEMHNDKHCIKMILEYCQLLSTAHRVLDGKETVVKTYVNGSLPARYRNVKKWKLEDERDSILYSATHINHPSAIWCRQNQSNYTWLYRLLSALMDEYTYRYGKKHKCEELMETLWFTPNNIPNGEFTQPTPAMPKEVVITGDSIASYRNYYINNKQHLASWKGKINSRNVPEWLNANVSILK